MPAELANFVIDFAVSKAESLLRSRRSPAEEDAAAAPRETKAAAAEYHGTVNRVVDATQGVGPGEEDKPDFGGLVLGWSGADLAGITANPRYLRTHRKKRSDNCQKSMCFISRRRV